MRRNFKVAGEHSSARAAFCISVGRFKGRLASALDTAAPSYNRTHVAGLKDGLRSASAYTCRELVHMGHGCGRTDTRQAYDLLRLYRENV